MARGTSLSKIITYGALAFVGVEVAAGGLIGQQAQLAGQKIANAIGLKVFISPPGLGAGSSAAAAGTLPPAATPIAPADCNVAFLPGIQYVAQLPDGTFQVVVKGRPQGNYNSQSVAEGVFNALVCKP